MDILFEQNTTGPVVEALPTAQSISQAMALPLVGAAVSLFARRWWVAGLVLVLAALVWAGVAHYVLGQPVRQAATPLAVAAATGVGVTAFMLVRGWLMRSRLRKREAVESGPGLLKDAMDLQRATSSQSAGGGDAPASSVATVRATLDGNRAEASDPEPTKPADPETNDVQDGPRGQRRPPDLSGLAQLASAGAVALKGAVEVMNPRKPYMEMVICYDLLHRTIFRLMVPQQEIKQHLPHDSRFVPQSTDSLTGVIPWAAALIGGLVLTVAFTIALSMVLLMPQNQAVLFGLMLGVLGGGAFGYPLGKAFASGGEKDPPFWIATRTKERIIEPVTYEAHYRPTDPSPGYVFEYMQMRDEMNLMRGDPTMLQKLIFGTMALLLIGVLLMLFMFWSELARIRSFDDGQEQGGGKQQGIHREIDEHSDRVGTEFALRVRTDTNTLIREFLDKHPNTPLTYRTTLA